MYTKRETLKKNQIITLKESDSEKKVTFQIRDEEVKEGSSCLVYRAICTDNNNPVILKELYPKYMHGVTRKPDGEISWYGEEAEEKDRDKVSGKKIKIEESRKRFSDSVDIMKEICKNSKYRHYIGADYNIELLEGNNTLYCINEDVGVTYIWSEVSGESVLDIMKCSLAIAIFLNYFHRMGYVYIDLKPENIIIPENGVQQIDYSNPKFIDFDSVLKSGQVYPISSIHGSPGYLPDYLPNHISKEIRGFTNDLYEGPEEYI